MEILIYICVGGGLTLELKECIKDSFDDAVSAYISSEEYQEQQKQINTMFLKIRNSLSEEQRGLFNELMDAIGNCNSGLASEAYVCGVVEGIALRKAIILE